MTQALTGKLAVLRREVIACERCPRLIEHCREMAAVKRRAYLDWEYWGKPVPSFGDPAAQLMIIGLAPAAHGANRTGRMFTGDRSGDFLYRALYETGFASQAESRSRADGLTLKGAYITASAHCAPPDNKPAPDELANCRPYLERELECLKHLRVVVALGRIAFDGYLKVLRDQAKIQSLAKFPFAHGAEHRTGPGAPVLLACYHPSQQNTSTGRLTAEMLLRIFARARQLSRG